MMKSFKYTTIQIISFLILTFGIIGCDQSPSSSADQPLIVATCADYPPFEFFKEGDIQGFDIDLIKAIAGKLGRPLEFKDMSFDAVLGALQSHRADIAISTISATEERRQAVDFSVPYFTSSRVLICSDLSPYRNVTDLTSATIGVQAGSSHETYANQFLRNLIAQLNVRSLPKIPELVQDLNSKRISCLILGTTEANSLLISVKNLRTIELPGEKNDLAIAFPKDSPLTAQVDEILQAFAKDGTLEQLKIKWNLELP